MLPMVFTELTDFIFGGHLKAGSPLTAMNTSVKRVFEGVNISGWNLGTSDFRGSLLVKSGPDFFLPSRDSSLPLVWELSRPSYLPA
jgi:hypothetical protein